MRPSPRILMPFLPAALLFGLILLVNAFRGREAQRSTVVVERSRVADSVRGARIDTLAWVQRATDTAFIRVAQAVQQAREVVIQSPPLTVRETVYVRQIDSVVRACTVFSTAALAERSACARALGADSVLIRSLRRQIATPPPSRRWGLGAAVGYGCVMRESTGCGPAVAAGLTFRF